MLRPTFLLTADRTGPAPRRLLVVRPLNATGGLVRQVGVVTGVDGTYWVVLRPMVGGSVVASSPAAPRYLASTGDAQSFTVTP